MQNDRSLAHPVVGSTLAESLT